MNNHLKKLSIKATINNLKVELKNATSIVKKKSLSNLIDKWSKNLDSLQIVPVLVPVYVSVNY